VFAGLNPTAQVSDYQFFDPYGQLVGKGSGLPQDGVALGSGAPPGGRAGMFRLGMTGKPWDPDAKLYHFGFRERGDGGNGFVGWLQAEPFGLDGPNLYQFVFGDPVNGGDLDGLFTIEYEEVWHTNGQFMGVDLTRVDFSQEINDIETRLNDFEQQLNSPEWRLGFGGLACPPTNAKDYKSLGRQFLSRARKAVKHLKELDSRGKFTLDLTAFQSEYRPYRDQISIASYRLGLDFQVLFGHQLPTKPINPFASVNGPFSYGVGKRVKKSVTGTVNELLLGIFLHEGYHRYQLHEADGGDVPGKAFRLTCEKKAEKAFGSLDENTSLEAIPYWLDDFWKGVVIPYTDGGFSSPPQRDEIPAFPYVKDPY